MIRKALTLYQPHAALVMIGAKKFETRSWPTKYRGELLIHAAKNSPQEYLNLMWEWPFSEALFPEGDGQYIIPVGCIIAKCELVDCQKITPENIPDEPEKSFGDYTPGRYMFKLANVRALEPIYQVKGHQRIWNWKGSILELAKENQWQKLKFGNAGFADAPTGKPVLAGVSGLRMTFAAGVTLCSTSCGTRSGNA